jgi:hypothetical protein
MRGAGLLVAGLLVGLAGAARAQEPELPLSLEGLAPAEVDARLGFLEERLDAGRFTAQAWQYGWSGVFGAGAVLSAAQAVTADDGDERVYQIVGTVKSVGALAQMLTDPLPARLGAEPLRDVPAATPRGRLQRLAVGERQVVENAARAESRYSLRRHLEGVTTNLIGGAVIWALGDSRDAVLSTLSGIAVGEAQIWSQPWRATSDLDDYREAFSTTVASRGIQWELRPTLNGVQLAFRY